MCEYFISETDVAQNMIIDLRGLFLENRSTSLLLIFDCALNFFLSLLKSLIRLLYCVFSFFFLFIQPILSNLCPLDHIVLLITMAMFLVVIYFNCSLLVKNMF